MEKALSSKEIPTRPKESSKTKDKNSNQEEDDHIKSILKDDISERSASVHESSGSNSFQNRSVSLRMNMRNSETDLDKIIAGKDDPQFNSNMRETLDFKEIQRKSEQDKNVMSNFNLGKLLRDIGLKKTMTRKERKSLFKNIFEEKEKDKDANHRDIINAQLNELKDNTLAFFLQTVKELENRYNEYINNLCKYIKNNEIRISKVFQQSNEVGENVMEFTENNIFQQVENILEIHENIFDALEDHVSLLGIFLEKYDLIQQKNPLEYFINTYSNNILNCWFLNKINFQKLNLRSFESNKDLSELYSKYLIKKKNNNFSNFYITQDSKGNLSTGSDFIKQNLKTLEKLTFTEVRGESINNIFKSNKKDDDITASRLKSLTIIESDFSSITLKKIRTPSLKKLKIKRTPLPLSLQGFFDSILFKSSYLQNLYLQKCFIDDESLSQIFKYFSGQPKLLESLQNISFLGNEISTVNMEHLIENNCQFKRLEFLDFIKNNIFDFLFENFKLLMNVKVLDLSDNNLTNYTFFEGIRNSKNIKCILFLSNNMFLTNNKNNRNRYLQYLHEKLGNYKSKVKKLNLSFLYEKETKPVLLKLKLSPIFKISLIKLNLSYCGLDSDTVCKFFNNNFGLLNLKIINLSSNFIDLKFFELIKNVDLSLEKLIILDLSLNDIHSMTLEDYQNIELFINKHPNFKKIKLQETVFVEDLLSLSQNESDKVGEINKNIMSREVKFVVDGNNTEAIEPLKELFEIKDKEL